MQACFKVVDRSDAILINTPVPQHPERMEGFDLVTVSFGEGVTKDSIGDSDVVLLQDERDQGYLRFERCDRKEWAEKCEEWQRGGWMPIGFEAVRFYETEEDWFRDEAE